MSAAAADSDRPEERRQTDDGHARGEAQQAYPERPVQRRTGGLRQACRRARKDGGPGHAVVAGRQGRRVPARRRRRPVGTEDQHGREADDRRRGDYTAARSAAVRRQGRIGGAHEAGCPNAGHADHYSDGCAGRYRFSGTSFPPAFADVSAASMKAMISSVSSIGTGGLRLWKNPAISRTSGTYVCGSIRQTTRFSV